MDKTREELIEELHKLVQQTGYLYVLCFLIYNAILVKIGESEDNEIIPKEINFIIEIFIQYKLDYTHPYSIEEFQQMYKQTIYLLKQIHSTHLSYVFQEIWNFTGKTPEDLFQNGAILKEGFSYSNEAAYDIQYVELIETKYKRDAKWLKSNYAFDIYEVQSIFQELRLLFEERFYQFIYSQENRDYPHSYDALLKIFILKESDITYSYFQTLYNLFSIELPYNEATDHNVFDSHPVIILDERWLFVPVFPKIFEAMYESPYYWLQQDEHYQEHLSQTRGSTGEEMTQSLLENVFPSDKIFRSITLESKKGQQDTEIDVICILDNVALSVQVKSKKLRMSSREGNLQHIQEDFNKFVQNAHKQNVKAHELLLSGKYTALDKEGKKISLPTIEGVYSLLVTTEDFPNLIQLVSTFLEKTENTLYPLPVTVFDLDLLTQYLQDPYEFMYYVKKRNETFDQLYADNEIVILGWYLFKGFELVREYDGGVIPPELASAIDQNYHASKLGIPLSKEEDQIKAVLKNRNGDFDKLCDYVKNLQYHKTPQMLFLLFDLPAVTKQELVDQFNRVKQQAEVYNRDSDTCVFDWHNNFGISLMATPQSDPESFSKKLQNCSQIKKYQKKCNYWLGIGYLLSSDKFIDIVVFNDEPWAYDPELEKLSKEKLTKTSQRKIGRNESCICGSGKKFKKCCGV